LYTLAKEYLESIQKIQTIVCPPSKPSILNSSIGIVDISNH